jgi:hypothetical protein
MLTIDHHVQSALYKFNREMKHLNQGEGQVPCQAGQPSKDGFDGDRPGMVKCLYRTMLTAFSTQNCRKEQEMLRKILDKRASKRSSLNGSLTTRAVLFAKATLFSSLSTEEKLSWLSIGTWIPYRTF